MNVSAPFIRRPVATTLLAVALLIVGVLGYRALPVASLPQVAFPVITVSTQLPGSNPETTAALITAPLERQLGQIAGLVAMTSSSSFGASRITLQFGLDRDIDGAAQDVQAAINAAGAALPRGLPYPPTYARANPADAPILTLALTSTTTPLRVLSDIVDTLVAQRLAEVSGVGAVSVQGGLKPAVRVSVDLDLLASKGLSLADLRAAVGAANLTSPKGTLDGPRQTYTIAANDQIASAREYARITLANRNGAPVFLEDVAAVTDGFENERTGAWFNGQQAVVIDVLRQPSANVVATVEQLKRNIPRIQRALPADVTLSVVADRTGVISASVHEVKLTLVIAVVLVVGVVLMFLRTWSATLIAGITLPLSLLGTFAVMWLVGFSLDNLSLMALVIGTGFVVDDAIVMIENIARHRERGGDGAAAAMAGASEIGFTVISLTVSLLAVFIPLLFMEGLVGRMFREFALTLSIAVVVSALVSLTLTPMLCAKLLKPSGNAHARDDGGDWLTRAYMASLGVVMRHRTLTLVVTLATCALTVWLYVAMPKSFLPEQDTGLVTVVARAAPDVSFTELARLQNEASRALRRVPEVAGLVAVAGAGPSNPTTNAATFTAVLTPHTERRRSAAEVARALEEELAALTGLAGFAKPVQEIQISTRQGWSQFQYTLVGPSHTEVRRHGLRLLTRLRDDATFRNVVSIEEDEGHVARVVVDRLRAGQMGVSMQTIADALNDSFAQRQISTIYGQANQYRVVIEAGNERRSAADAIEGVRVPGTGGVQVPLAAIARVERIAAPLALGHHDQFPAMTIAFDLGPERALDEAVAAIQAAQRALDVPETITGTFFGEAAEFRTTLAGQPLLILAALVSIYIVLGVLYESYIHPLTILSTLPSAGVGALVALSAVGEHLTVVGVIGIILLMGIVKKNAILMIDFALHAERDRGMRPEAAIIEACRLRFRPIMMTTLAALFGALPLAFAEGPGAELRMPLGVAVVGGLVLSQLLTLYTTPVVFLALDAMRAPSDRRATGAAAQGVST